MATLLGSLLIRLGLDRGDFTQGLAVAERELKSSTKRIEKIGRSMTDIGKTLSLAITAPLTAFGLTSFKAASDAAELRSSFDQTFGAMAASMGRWAEETGNAMGRSTQEMQKAANTFGIFFNTAASPAKAAAMSKTFSTLAQDLGSFFNVDTDTAIEKLRSGLSGESEPLRDFGVFLTEASVKAKAMELGLTGVGNELTEQEKILARYQLILEATTKAQGDVERTSGGTANQLRASKAAWEELQVIVGTKLLPVLTPLIEKIGAALNWFSQLPAPVQNTALVLGAFAAVTGPLLMGLGGLLQIGAPVIALFKALSGASAIVGIFKNLIPMALQLTRVLAAMALTPVGATILAIAGAATAVYLAWKHWDKIIVIVRNLYTGVKTWLQDKLGEVFNWVQGKLTAVGGWFYDLYDKVVGHSYIPDMVDGIAAEMARLDAVLVDPADRATKKTGESFRALAGEVQGILDRLFPELARARTYAQEAGTLAAGIKDPEARKVALRALGNEEAGLSRDGLSFDVAASSKPIEITGEAVDKLSDKLLGLRARAGETTVHVAESFKDMADKTLSAISRVADAIKGGGFLGILESIVGLGLQLGSVGAFGKTIANRLNAIPGRAAGGPVTGGRPYLVGERGPELVVPRRSGTVIPNHALGAGGGGDRHYHFTGNLMTPEFWRMIQSGDERAARGGAALAHKQSAFTRQWSLAG